MGTEEFSPGIEMLFALFWIVVYIDVYNYESSSGLLYCDVNIPQ